MEIVHSVQYLWKRVENLIKAHNIDRKKFLEYVGIPRSTYYSWLRNNRSMEIFTAYRIATALGVSLEYLVTGIDGKSAEERMKQTEIRKTVEAEMKKLVVKMQEEVEKL